MPGDLVIGDADGVVIVPREEASAVLELVLALVAREQKRVAEIDAGVLFKSEIDEILKKRGVIS
jgi:regulator of RNase E activity RraA